MNADRPAYQPISCNFHDLLEAAATRRTVVRLEVSDAAGVRALDARIVDFVTDADGEYLVLDSGMSLRLDCIVSIDGERLTDDPG